MRDPFSAITRLHLLYCMALVAAQSQSRFDSGGTNGGGFVVQFFGPNGAPNSGRGGGMGSMGSGNGMMGSGNGMMGSGNGMMGSGNGMMGSGGPMGGGGGMGSMGSGGMGSMNPGGYNMGPTNGGMMGSGSPMFGGSGMSPMGSSGGGGTGFMGSASPNMGSMSPGGYNNNNNNNNMGPASGGSAAIANSGISTGSVGSVGGVPSSRSPAGSGSEAAHADGLQDSVVNLSKRVDILEGKMNDMHEEEMQEFWQRREDGDKYRLYELRKTWGEAVAICNQSNAHLVTVQDAEYNTFLTDLIKTKPGVKYAWLDTRTMPVVRPSGAFSNMDKHNKHLQCTVLNTTGNWELHDCNLERAFICEIKAVRPATPSSSEDEEEENERRNARARRIQDRIRLRRS